MLILDKKNQIMIFRECLYCVSKFQRVEHFVELVEAADTTQNRHFIEVTQTFSESYAR